MTNKDEPEMVHIGLNINDNGEAVSITLMPYEDDEGKHIQVAAVGLEASHDGAKAVIATLIVAAEAIGRELGIALDSGIVSPEPPKRPRFNPQPAGGKK